VTGRRATARLAPGAARAWRAACHPVFAHAAAVAGIVSAIAILMSARSWLPAAVLAACSFPRSVDRHRRGLRGQFLRRISDVASRT
jgi:hypothetical protein